MTDWDLLLTDANIATMRRDSPGFGVVEDGAIAIADGSLAWLGPHADLPENTAAVTRSLAGQWLRRH